MTEIFREMNCKFIATFLDPTPTARWRTYLQETLGTKVYDLWDNETALAALNARINAAAHYEDLYLFEIVDTETGQTLPDGQTGNIVITCCAAPSRRSQVEYPQISAEFIATETLRSGSHFQAHGPLPRTKRRHGPHAAASHLPHGVPHRPCAAMNVRPGSGCA